MDHVADADKAGHLILALEPKIYSIVDKIESLMRLKN